MIQQRRGPAPFLIAIAVAVLLIVGLRLLFNRDASPGSDGGTQPVSACQGDDRVRLNLTMSSEKAELVREIAGDWLRSGPRAGGRCVDLQIATKASGAAMAALARGWNEAADGPRPDVWSPASSGWVTLLRQRTATADRPDFVPEGDAPRIAASPLVVAMPRPMAEAIGWPRKELGWRDLLDLAQDPAGWGRLKHPEWGRFKLGKTNPNFSTSGLNATVGTYFAATGLTSDLSARNVADPKVRRFVGGVERSVVHYGDTTLTFLANLQRADDEGLGLSYISAVTVEEKSVWDYNQGNPTGDPKTLNRHPKPKVPLVAIYPKEGTLLSDHPYVVLDAPWVDEAKRQAAAGFLAHLQGGSAQGKFERFAFRNYKNAAGPLITEANGLLPTRPSALLSPPSPAVLDQVLRSWAELRKRANVLLVMDVSGSMAEPVGGTGKSKLELAKAAAVNSLEQFSPADEVGLWVFSTQLDGTKDHRELVPVGRMGDQVDGRRRSALLRERIEALIPEGGTGLYDTSLAGYQFIKERFQPGSINAVMVLTDGKNEDPGSISLDNLERELKSERGDQSVRLFTVAYGDKADLGVLRRIAEATNGAAYDSSDPTSIDRVFTAVISNF